MNDDNGLLPPLRLVQPDEISGDFGSVLDQLERHLRRFVAFTSEHQPVAIVLWVAHTHAAEAAEQSPILAVVSPVKRAGKTRLLDAIEHVVREPWRVVRPSESVLIRKIERHHP